jgi:osomolarity two-component system sensor histidine kinase TcsA
MEGNYANGCACQRSTFLWNGEHLYWFFLDFHLMCHFTILAGVAAPRKSAGRLCHIEFFIAAGTSRLAKGLLWGPIDIPLKITLDFIAATIGIPTAILAWPVLQQVGVTRQAEQRMNELFRTMVTNVKEYAIYLIDPNGTILTWNEGAERLKGYSADEVIGKNFRLFYPQEAIESGHPAQELKAAVENGHYREEGWRVRKDGTQFWALVTITPVYDQHGNLAGFTKVTRDMTDRKQFEEQLAEQRDRALEASAMKSAFVANISHEIRTPLSGILGMNELLLRTELTDEQREYAETVHASSQSLLTILNDVLDLAKVEAGKIHLESVPFDLSLVSCDAVRLMTAAAKNKELELTCDIKPGIPDTVIGDPERLWQILLNMVGNAIKFTADGGVYITIEVMSEYDNTATIKFSVRDTGIGIAPEERKYLFMPFGQVDSSSTRKHGGTGLGLTISKHLVEMMGGSIGFESEKGHGSLFWFTIPFPKTDKRPTALAGTGTMELVAGQPIALIVEDNPVLRDLLSKQLANLGVRSQAAESGSAAIQAVRAREFDLIFMDVHLPELDGYETVQAIRRFENGNHKQTPIIAMTAGGMKGDRERALAAGMDDFILKPIGLDGLRRICGQWLDDSQRHWVA